MLTKSFEWIDLLQSPSFWKHHIYLPFDITIVIHSKHPRKAKLQTHIFIVYVNSKLVWDSFFKSGLVLKFINYQQYLKFNLSQI